MSRVKAFATGIKIESSDQSPFVGLIKVTSELLKSRDQEHTAAIDLDPLKIKCSRASEGNSQAIKHTLLIKNLTVANA